MIHILQVVYIIIVQQDEPHGRVRVRVRVRVTIPYHMHWYGSNRCELMSVIKAPDLIQIKHIQKQMNNDSQYYYSSLCVQCRYVWQIMPSSFVGYNIIYLFCFLYMQNILTEKLS